MAGTQTRAQRTPTIDSTILQIRGSTEYLGYEVRRRAAFLSVDIRTSVRNEGP
jgi:hypothetical protein